jgi:hypothetical protein
MASLNGKWLLTSIDNLEAYLNTTHSPDEFKNRMLALSKELGTTPNLFVEEIHVDKGAGNVSVKVYIKGELKQDLGPIGLGQEIDHTGVDGRPAKIKVSVESDTKVLMNKKGPNFESLINVQLLSTDEMTTTLTSSGVTCTEKYKRI